MKRLVPISLLLLPLFGYAQQQDTTVLLKQVEVRPASKNDIQTGKSVYSRSGTAQLAFPAGSLADVLESTTPFFIKSYGSGLLSSNSLRGSAATHTPVIWNGINLQSSMNGQLDLALMPAGFFNSIDVIPGGGSDLFGSGAIGGVIQLKNDGIIAQKFRASVSLFGASFGKNTQSVNLSGGRKRVSTRLTLFRQAAENNYPFYNRALPGKPREFLKNASLDAQGMMFEMRIILSDRIAVSLHSWYQNNERQIPATMIVPLSAASQKDEAWRNSAIWHYTRGKWKFIIRNAFLHENLWYNDSNISLFSSNKAYSFINEIESHRQIGSYDLFAGLNSTENRALVDGYEDPEWKKQSRLSAFAALQKFYFKGKAKWKLSLREEVNDGKAAPLAWSAGTDIVLKDFSLRAHFARVYRLPNFNDLYWVPGGNRAIKPENGYTAEAGGSYKYDNSARNFHLKASVTAYYTLLDNWIIWLPQAGYWTPTNLQQVHSRGLEWETEYRKLFIRNLQSVTIQYGGALTFSSNEKAKSQGDLSVGKQLIYVPYWKNYGRIEYSTGKFTLIYQQQVTGARYTSSDNTSSLPAFYTGDVIARYAFARKHFSIAFSGAVRNIWNHSYEVIEWRPMPGRNFELGIKLSYF